MEFKLITTIASLVLMFFLIALSWIDYKTYRLPNKLTFPLMLIGFGLSPIFPAMIHETPVRFGKEFSQIIIGYQMGFAYVGIATIPPLMGIVAKKFSTNLIPYFWLIATISMIIIYYSLIKLLKKNQITV